MKLFGKKTKEKVVAIFDIGSDSVGAGLLIVGRGPKPTLVYQTRIPIQFQEELAFDRFVDSTTAAVVRSVDTLIKEGMHHLNFTKYGKRRIDSIAVSFSSPWYISQVKTFEYTYTKPETFTKSFVADVLKKEEKAFLNSKITEYAEQSEKSPLLIDRRVIDIRLNGYAVDMPYGKKAQTVSMTVLLSAISERVRERIGTILEKYFHQTPVVYDSFGLIGFSALRDLFHTQEHFLMCDITGEVTDVALVRDEVLVRTGSFPNGTRDVIRAVTKKLATTSVEAASAVRQYIRGDIDTSTSLKMEEIMYVYRDEWQKTFRKTLNAFGEGYALPQTVFLVTNESFAPLFEGYISDLEHKGVIGIEGAMKVVPINASLFAKHLFVRRGEVVDVFLAMLAIFYTKIERLEEDM